MDCVNKAVAELEKQKLQVGFESLGIDEKMEVIKSKKERLGIAFFRHRAGAEEEPHDYQPGGGGPTERRRPARQLRHLRQRGRHLPRLPRGVQRPRHAGQDDGGGPACSASDAAGGGEVEW
jgi:hypothetical protein